MIFVHGQKGEPVSDSIKRQAAIDTVHRMREILDTDNIDDYEELLAEALAQLTPQLKDPDSTDFSDGFAMGYKVGQDDALQADFQSQHDKDLIQRFRDYQIDWLTSHNDIELEPQMEELIINFLRDTASCFILEDSE